MLIRKTDKVLKDLFTLDTAAARVHRRSHDKIAGLAVFVSNDLRMQFTISKDVRRLDGPTRLFKLFKNYFNTEGVNIRLHHYFLCGH